MIVDEPFMIAMHTYPTAKPFKIYLRFRCSVLTDDLENKRHGNVHMLLERPPITCGTASEDNNQKGDETKASLGAQKHR